MNTSKDLKTICIHAGESERRLAGAAVFPIFQSAMFEYTGESNYHDLKYIRLNNTPNHAVLHDKLAQMADAEAAVVTGSGMAAISTTLLTFLKPGDHLLVQGNLYGGTHSFVTADLAELDIAHTFLDATDPNQWAQQVQANTKAIYVESMSNPLLQVMDLQAVVDFARSQNLVSMIDNTFATPVNFKPIPFGFDISLHSATKYLNGHSDIVAGVVLGTEAHIESITHRLKPSWWLAGSACVLSSESWPQDLGFANAASQSVRPEDRRVPTRAAAGRASQLPRPYDASLP